MPATGQYTQNYSDTLADYLAGSQNINSYGGTGTSGTIAAGPGFINSTNEQQGLANAQAWMNLQAALNNSLGQEGYNNTVNIGSGQPVPITRHGG